MCFASILWFDIIQASAAKVSGGELDLQQSLFPFHGYTDQQVRLYQPYGRGHTRDYIKVHNNSVDV